MNFFWKIFFSIMLTITVFFSIGGYYLINSSFRSSLDREISVAYEEIDILYYTLNRELQNEEPDIPYYSLEESTQYQVAPARLPSAAKQEMTPDAKKALLVKIADSVTINTAEGIIPFRLSDDTYEIIYEREPAHVNNQLLSQLPKDSKGHEIVNADGFYYIHTAAPLIALGETFYIENFRNISFLFENRDQQYRIFSYLILIMVLISGIVVFFVAGWLTRPIRRLSRATKQIAKGNFNQRVPVISQDEIGRLSQDFNRMTDRLEETVDELKASTRRQENFVASFAHELKTPLTSIIGYADMLRSKKLPEEQIFSTSHYIFQEGKRLESLSMKLMHLIVLEKQEWNLRPVFMPEFLDEVGRAMDPIFKNAGIFFSVKAEAGTVKIEPDLMKTVCMNLLDNARKAIDGQGAVSLEGKVTLEGYAICVIDNGKGMEASALSKITEAFYMVDKSRARAQGGAGLGLTICAQIVTLHHGKLLFESRPDEGTCATIQLAGGAGL